jgi:hypothetical protein
MVIIHFPISNSALGSIFVTTQFYLLLFTAVGMVQVFQIRIDQLGSGVRSEFWSIKTDKNKHLFILYRTASLCLSVYGCYRLLSCLKKILSGLSVHRADFENLDLFENYCGPSFELLIIKNLVPF